MEHVLIPSSKGFTLTLTHFPSPPSAPLLPAVIIAPATGVAASFYVSYASHLQSLGAAVTIVDYRYSGLSFPQGAESKEERREALIRATDVNIGTDWAGDMDSALGWVVEKYRERGIVAVCHSVGGHLLTLCSAENLRHVKRALFVGVFNPAYCLSEYGELRKEKWMQIMEQADQLGFFPGKRWGFGNDLPRGIGQQWSGWMEIPTYYAEENTHILKDFAVPIFSLAFVDDLLAEETPIKTDAILLCLPLAPSTRVHYDPESEGWQPIGHINAFSPLQRSTANTGGIWNVMSTYILKGVAHMKGGNVRDFNGGGVEACARM